MQHGRTELDQRAGDASKEAKPLLARRWQAYKRSVKGSGKGKWGTEFGIVKPSVETASGIRCNQQKFHQPPQRTSATNV
jgi:hypothetical protein